MEDVVGRPHPHQVARLLVGQRRREALDHVAARRGSLADGDAADRVAVEVERLELLDRALAQARIDAALDDAEQRGRAAAVALARRGAPSAMVRSSAAAAAASVTGHGGHSSSTIARSTPIRSCISTTDSGVSRTRLPSRWLLKSTPSSSTERRSESENTWNPPLSVTSVRDQPQKRWSPPTRSMVVDAGPQRQVVEVGEHHLGARLLELLRDRAP